MSFAELLSYISTLTVLIPFLYCLIAVKKKDTFIHRSILLLSISIVTSIVTEYFTQTGSQITILCFNLYTLLEFMGISLVYVTLLPHWRKKIFALMAVYAAFYAADSYWLESFNTIQDYPLVVESLIVMVYCIIYFFHSLKNISHDYSLFQDGKFWVNIAFLSYFMYSIGLFAIAKHIFTELEPATAQALWSIHNINYIIKNLLLAVGVYCVSKISQPPFELFGADEKWWRRLPPNSAKDITVRP